MKYSKLFLTLAAAVALGSCSEDDLNSTSIFDTDAPQRTEFDQWLKTNYTDPYNIEFNYLYNDKLSDLGYNVTPAQIDNSKALAKLVKHVWMDAYCEVAGEDFLKSNSFRQIQLIGSYEYDGQGSIVLGTADGGMKVLLFGVNSLDLDNIYINQTNPYRSHGAAPLDLNYWYFHTMHHEFCHILTQKKEYTTEFRDVSAGSYHAADWINVEDVDAPMEGFVTGYGSGEYNEDFAEIYSTYVTSSPAAWEEILKHGVDTLDYDVTYVDDLDADGNRVLITDALGSFIPETDAAGNIIYEKDANGNYIYYTDANGNPYPAYTTQSQSLYYLDESPYIAWVYSNGLYPLTTRLQNDTPVYQKTIDGEIAYDANGNPVPEYYRVPVFKCKQKEIKTNVVVDTTGKDKILQKLEMVKSYFSDSWGIDLDKLREVVLRRSSEAPALDLKTLN